MFKPTACYQMEWSGHVIALAPGDIPTVDYYVTPRMGEVTGESLRCLDSRRTPMRAEPFAIGTFVVIVRHASPAWLAWIEKNQDCWSGVAFLMDDDIPGAWRCSDVPLDYGLWTSSRYWLTKRRLARVCDRIWMSTDCLRRRFAQIPTTLVKPRAFASRSVGPSPAGTRRWGYHGTRIHQRELRWLVPVVENVQHAITDAEFEVFGDRHVERLFAHIPRVKVLRPCVWPEYVAHCLRSSLAVGLAPILPGRFNRERSHTKAFDIARCGAAGLFSNRDHYATALANNEVSLLPDRHTVWTDEVIRLLQDDEQRLARHQQLMACLEQCNGGEKIFDLITEKRN